MTSIEIQPDSQVAPAMPRIAVLTSRRVPPDVPAHPISHVSEIEPRDEVVLLHGPGMGSIAAALATARSIGRRVPPVVVIAPEVDRADIVRAFSGGPVSYSLEGASRPVLADLLRLAAQGQYALHPEVLRALLRCGERSPAPSATEPLTGREEAIMSLLAAGEDVAEISRRLVLSQKTVRNNLTRIFTKLRVRRQTEAVLRWRGLA
ncbi:LuxR C-terminal-related transcriptional regulator [Lentzea sp. NPDC004789]